MDGQADRNQIDADELPLRVVVSSAVPDGEAWLFQRNDEGETVLTGKIVNLAASVGMVMDGQPDTTIHALLDEAAQHVPTEDDEIRVGGVLVCPACFNPWPCLVAKLATEIHALRRTNERTELT